MSAEKLQREVRWALMDKGQHVLAVAIDELCRRLIGDDDAAEIGILTIDPGTSPTVAVKGKRAA